MGVTVGANNQTVVHKGSGGISTKFPDVCLTKVGKPIIPIPYTNIAKSSDIDKCAETVTADGNPLGHEDSIFKTSIGDEAGSKKGVSSGTVADKAEFISCSSDVEVEGKGVVRAMDKMIHNNKNTGPAPLMQPPLIQTIQDETPVIPEQGKVEVQFIDPFGNPMEGVGFKTEFNSKKKTEKTMSLGQVFHIADQEQVDIVIEHIDFGLEEEE